MTSRRRQNLTRAQIPAFDDGGGGPVTNTGNGRTLPGFITQRGNNLTFSEAHNPATGGHSILTDWRLLQPSETAGTTTGPWATLLSTIDTACTTNRQLLLRIESGIEASPDWLYTHSTRPVSWINAKDGGTHTSLVAVHTGTAPSFDPDAPAYNPTTGANEQVHYPMPMLWDPGDVPSLNPSDTTIKAAVAGSALRYHWRRFLQLKLAPWMALACPNDATHTRGSHLNIIPVCMPSVFGTEMTTSNANPVKKFVVHATSAMSWNNSNLRAKWVEAVGSVKAHDDSSDLQVAYKHAWTLAMQDMCELIPAPTQFNVMAGVCYGSVQVQFDLLEQVMTTLNKRVIIGRTDLRESYFRDAGTRGAFGGGVANSKSPIRLLMRAHELGVPYCIQTAGDAEGVGVAGFFDYLPQRTKTVQHAVDTWQEFLSRCPYPVFCETSLSWTDTGGSGFFAGEAMSTVLTGGTGNPMTGLYDGVTLRWPGGTVNARTYLTGTRGVQTQMQLPPA